MNVEAKPGQNQKTIKKPKTPSAVLRYADCFYELVLFVISLTFIVSYFQPSLPRMSLFLVDEPASVRLLREIESGVDQIWLNGSDVTPGVLNSLKNRRLQSVTLSFYGVEEDEVTFEAATLVFEALWTRELMLDEVLRWDEGSRTRCARF